MVLKGLLCRLEDAKALAERIERLVSDRQLRQQMSENAKQRARDFTWHHYRERLLQAVTVPDTEVVHHGLLGFFCFFWRSQLGGLVLAFIWLAYKRSRDSLHPMMYLGLLLFYLYSYLPINLVRQDAERLQSYLSVQQLDYVQFINLAGAFCICGRGALWSEESIFSGCCPTKLGIAP